MADVQRTGEIRGKTVRFIWEGGPTGGTTHEHVFHEDGTVEWRDVKEPRKDSPSKERPEYAAIRVEDGIYLISYLAGSGYTLTVVLNDRDKSLVGFASGAKEWFPVQGRFEVVE